MYTLFDKINYTISPAVLTNISYIYQLRGKIETHAHLKDITKIEEIKIIEVSHHSTKIEGNNISFPLSKQLLYEQKPIPASDKDKRELMNTYDLIKTYKSSTYHIKDIDLKSLNSFHKVITDSLIPDTRSGQLRDQQNVVKTGGLIVYMPPEADDVKNLLEKLLIWIEKNHNEVEPILLSFIIHHSLLLIHPYMDGNGRLSRFVQLLTLRDKGFGTYKIFSLDTECELHLQEYYDAIHIGNNRYTTAQADGTKFIEFMSLMMVYTLEKTLQELIDL